MTQQAQASKKSTGRKKSATAKNADKGTAAEHAQEHKINADERHRLIAETAYAIAERSGFQGDPIENWLLAEAEVDAQFAARH